jgi:hypothetical protein
MTFPVNPQDQDRATVGGQIYVWNQAKTAWQKVSLPPENFDATTVDGLDSSQFLRRDQNQTMNGDLAVSGQLSSSVGLTVTAPSSIEELAIPVELTVADQLTANDLGLTVVDAEIENLTVTQTAAFNNGMTVGQQLVADQLVLQGTSTLTVINEDDLTTSELTLGASPEIEVTTLSETATSGSLSENSVIDLDNSVNSSLVTAAYVSASSISGFISESATDVIYYDRFDDTAGPALDGSKWTEQTGVVIANNGTGTGTGGFSASVLGSTKHATFINGTGTRQITTTTFDARPGVGIVPLSVTGLVLRYIHGSGTNGGALVSAGEGLVLSASYNGGVDYSIIQTFSLSTTWTLFSSAASLPGTGTETFRLRLTQNGADGNNLDAIGVDDIGWTYFTDPNYSHIEIGPRDTTETGSLRTRSISAYNISSVSFRAIRGNNSNGAPTPVSNNLELWYSIDDGLSWAQISVSPLSVSWANYTIDTQGIFSNTDFIGKDVILEFRNPNSGPQVFGIKNITISYNNSRTAYLTSSLPLRLSNAGTNVVANSLSVNANAVNVTSIDHSINSLNITLGNSASTGRVVINNTASSSSVNATNSLTTSGGIFASGIIRAGSGFFGNVTGNLTGTASFASSASTAQSAGRISSLAVDQQVGSVFMDPVTYPSNATLQIPVSLNTFGAYNYTVLVFEVVGYYYTPTSTNPTSSARFYKKWHLAINSLPATWLIESGGVVYSFNSDATNFPAGAFNTGKTFASISSNQVFLNFVQRTTPAADSGTNFTYNWYRYTA